MFDQPLPVLSNLPRAQQHTPQLDHTTHSPWEPPAAYARSQSDLGQQLPWQQEPLYKHQQQHIYHHQLPHVPQQQQQQHYYRNPVFPTSWPPTPAVEVSSPVSLKAELSYSLASSDNSDVTENPLIEGIDKDMLAAQDEVHKMYVDPDSINDPEQSFEIPQQLSKLEDENYDLHKKMNVLRHEFELQQEKLNQKGTFLYTLLR